MANATKETLAQRISDIFAELREMGADTPEFERVADYAHSILRDRYFRAVRSMADSLIEEIKSGEITNQDDFETRLHEDCDSSQWIIYTWRAQQVLTYSDNSGAGPDELGADGFDWSAGIPYSQLAFWAFMRDIREQFDAEIDANDWEIFELLEEFADFDDEQTRELLKENDIETGADESPRETVISAILSGDIDIL